jgi:hypothetical protein
MVLAVVSEYSPGGHKDRTGFTEPVLHFDTVSKG